MTTLIGAPACALAAFLCLRVTPLPWNVIVALALFASPFAPLLSVTAVLGVLVAAPAKAGPGTQRPPPPRRPRRPRDRHGPQRPSGPHTAA